MYCLQLRGLWPAVWHNGARLPSLEVALLGHELCFLAFAETIHHQAQTGKQRSSGSQHSSTCARHLEQDSLSQPSPVQSISTVSYTVNIHKVRAVLCSSRFCQQRCCLLLTPTLHITCIVLVP